MAVHRKRLFRWIAVLGIVPAGFLCYVIGISLAKSYFTAVSNTKGFVVTDIGKPLVEYEAAEGLGPIFYEPEEFEAWCRGLPGRWARNIDKLCVLVVPMPLVSVPEENLRGDFEQVLVFLPNVYSGLLLRSGLPFTFHYALVPGRSPRCIRMAYRGEDLREGELSADEFFSIASGMWQAARTGDRNRFKEMRASFRPSDIFVGIVLVGGERDIRLSGLQLEAMATLLEEKQFGTTPVQ